MKNHLEGCTSYKFPAILGLHPWRQERVDELIVDNETPQTFELSRDAQADVRSLAFAELGPKMLALVEGRDGVDIAAVATLNSWDYEMVRDKTAPLIFMAWLRESMIGIYSDDLGPSFDMWFKARANVMIDLLDGRNRRDWCDDGRTSEKESCADMLAAALYRAVADLEDRYGADRQVWKWGAAHTSAGTHTPFSRVFLLNRFFDVSTESAGGPFTLDRGRTRLENAETPFINTNGSSFRGIYDFADLDRSTYIQTSGQSGNPFSDHYRDFAVRWSNVQGITIPADPKIYEPETVGTWRLAPK